MPNSTEWKQFIFVTSSISFAWHGFFSFLCLNELPLSIRVVLHKISWNPFLHYMVGCVCMFVQSVAACTRRARSSCVNSQFVFFFLALLQRTKAERYFIDLFFFLLQFFHYFTTEVECYPWLLLSNESEEERQLVVRYTLWTWSASKQIHFRW